MSASNSRIKNGIWFALVGTAPTFPCHWCGKPLSFKEATLDHEPALALGGARHKAVIACYDCNQKRSHITSKIVNEGRELLTTAKTAIDFLK